MKNYLIQEVQERSALYGSQALSDRELLALIIGNLPAATALLEMGESLNKISKWSLEELCFVPGISKATASKLMASFSLFARSAPLDRGCFTTPDAVSRYMHPLTAPLTVEKFWVLCLDRKNRLLKRVEISSGTATSCLVHPREAFRAAILHTATAIIAVHNHPSGDPAPSRADMQVTRQLREASKIIGVDLDDHIIIGERELDPLGIGYYSFSEAGLI